MDQFSSHSDAVSAPSRAPYAVTPSDTLALTKTPKALFIGTAGDIVLRGVDGQADVTFKAVPAGSILAVRAEYLRATGTTAADIVALA